MSRRSVRFVEFCAGLGGTRAGLEMAGWCCDLEHTGIDDAGYLLRLVDDYAPDNVSDKVLRILMSYTDFVNRRTWHR